MKYDLTLIKYQSTAVCVQIRHQFLEALDTYIRTDVIILMYIGRIYLQ